MYYLVVDYHQQKATCFDALSSHQSKAGEYFFAQNPTSFSTLKHRRECILEIHRHEFAAKNSKKNIN